LELIFCVNLQKACLFVILWGFFFFFFFFFFLIFNYFPEDGISIPFQSNSFLAPISSTILYNQVLNLAHYTLTQNSSHTESQLQNQPKNNHDNHNYITTTNNSCENGRNDENDKHIENGQPIKSTSNTKNGSPADKKAVQDNNIKKDNTNNTNHSNNNNNHVETPVRQITGIPPDYYFEVGYVVKLDNVLFLDDSRPCFSFSHPNRYASAIDNSRHTQIWFQPKMDSLLHGFAGFFEALLHEKIAFSKYIIG
jgi:hypothetical protein